MSHLVSFFQGTENVHQNVMLLSGEMQYRRVRGHHGGFSQFGEGTRNKKKSSQKTDVFFAQRGPNGFRMCLF